jgi:hypothetical protein
MADSDLAAAANHATAQEVDPSIADSDGIVPIYSVCFGSDASEPYVPGAAYIPYYDGTSVQGIILFDECVAQELGLGPTDIQRALESRQLELAGARSYCANHAISFRAVCSSVSLAGLLPIAITQG